MIQFEPLSESRHHHFAKELFESAFPEEERPPFSSLEDRDDRFHFLVAILDDEPLGILTYWVFEEFAYIEHFAIDREYRGRGLGKATMLAFLAHHSDQVVLETELPSTEQAAPHIIDLISLVKLMIPQTGTASQQNQPQSKSADTDFWKICFIFSSSSSSFFLYSS